MIVKNLYKVTDNNSVMFTTEIPEESDYELHYRLIASGNMELTLNGADTYSAIDVESTEGWYEVPASQGERENLSQQGELYLEFLESRGIPTA